MVELKAKKEKRFKKNKIVYKKNINLVYKEITLASPQRLIPTLLLMIIMVGCIAKFGVYEVYEKVDIAERELNKLIKQSSDLDEFLIDEEEIRYEHQKYSTQIHTPEELTIVDKSEILDLIEKYIMPVATIENFSISGTEGSMELTNINLDETALMMANLKTSPLVGKVVMNSAKVINETTKDLNVKIAITLTNNIEMSNDLAGGSDE